MCSLLILAPFAGVLFGGLWTSEFVVTASSELVLLTVRDSLMTSIVVASLTTAAAIVAVGLLVRRRYVPAEAKWAWVLAVPLAFSVIVRLYSILVLLAKEGLVNLLFSRLCLSFLRFDVLYTDTAVAFGLGIFLFPYAVIMASTVVGEQRREAVIALVGAGASFPRAYCSAALRPFWIELTGVFMVIMLLALGYFLTPAVLGGPQSRSISYVIYDWYMHSADFGKCIAMSTALMGVEALAAIVWLTLAYGKGRFRE